MELTIAFLTYNLLLFFVINLVPGKFINNNMSIQMVENDKFKWNFYLVILLALIVVIAGTRESYVGTDYSGYLDFYNYILIHGKIGQQFKTNEFFWEYLNYSSATLGIASEIFFGFIAGLIWFFFIKGSYKYQFLLPLMLFFAITSGLYFWTMSGLRQSIAMMIFFYAIKFIIEKNFKSYVLWVFIATLFHSSAIILFPIYLLNKIQFNRKIVFILFTLSILMIGNSWFISKITFIIQLLLSQIDSLSKYDEYLDSQKILFDGKRTGSGLGVIVRISITYFILYKSKITLEKIPSLNIYYILFFISAIASNIFYSVELVGRILNYFSICFPIVIASVIYYSDKVYDRYISIGFIISYLIIFNKQIFDIFN